MEKLQVYSASKSFGSKKVLKEISFTLQRGELVGLFGRNGSGKSTLLQLLFGTLKADEISFSIDDTPIKPLQVIPKQYIAYLPQHPFLPKQMKVRDLIPLFHRAEATQDAIFYDPHIATMTHKQTGTLSVGELKYFEVVLLAHLPHPFLLMDEPFSMLEPLHKEKLKEFLLKLKQRKGIIVTDHYYHDVLEVSDKNIVLKDGIAYQINNEGDLRKFEYLNKRS
ncbi:ATP-binding cassette domain-containing protein [Rasiella sp. SM2506]|uniref:ATP-binding cassette domain-containing protein n=1 Tax=Rasiella sp. SM2506 TaxID=3423914 RepID=UPI003D7A1F30